MHEGLGHKKITSGSLISSLVSESGLSHTLNSTIEYTADLTHYSIKPDNKQDLPAALNRATPNGNYHASAHWNISWRFNYQIVNAQCKIQSAQVNLTSQMLMPQLDVGFNTDSQTRDTFNEYYENLITHEFGHLDFGVLAANQIESMLLDQTTMAQCDDLGAASNAQAKSIIAQYTTLDDEYDESTSHGRTQGAYIHDLLN